MLKFNNRIINLSLHKNLIIIFLFLYYLIRAINKSNYYISILTNLNIYDILVLNIHTIITKMYKFFEIIMYHY